MMEKDIIEIEVPKSGKTRNIRSLIHEVMLDDEACCIKLMLSMSSEASLNPENLFQYISGLIGQDLEYDIKRTGLYTVMDGCNSCLCGNYAVNN